MEKEILPTLSIICRIAVPLSKNKYLDSIYQKFRYSSESNFAVNRTESRPEHWVF